jgi:Transcriptional regulators
MKLNDTDIIILEELLKDGRASFADIGKKCNKSKGVIANRFKQLELKGIIQGATIQNSIACYNKNMIADMFLVTEIGKVDQVLPLLAKFPQIIQTYHPRAESWIEVYAVFSNSEEFQNARQQLINLPFVNDVESHLFLGTRNHPENLSIFGNQLKLKETKKARLKSDIDDTDRLLIEQLAANGRKTFSQMSDELGIALETLSRRYEKLVDNGDIRVVIRIDPRKIGYPAFAVAHLKFVKADVNISYSLSCIRDVTQIQRTSGTFDYSVIIMLRDIQHLIDVQNKIRMIPGIVRLDIHIDELFAPWPTYREFKTTE